MSHQILKDESGNDAFIVLPIGEWDDMVDSLEANRIMADIESGRTETFSSEFVKTLLEADSQLKAWREYRRMTQQALADASGISRNYISEIESLKRDGTVKTLLALAGALDIDLDDLVD